MESPQILAYEGPFRHTYIHTRGLRLHVALDQYDQEDPERPLILLIHDSFGAWFDFMHMIDPLAKQGYRVAAVDLRGFGLSDKPPRGYDFYRIVGDVAGLIRSLGVSQAILVGAGTGAGIAWTVAANYPDHVSALVSLAGVHPLAFRRACLRRPFAHYGTLTRAFLCRLPFGETLRWLDPSTASLSLSHACSRGFKKSPAFKEALAHRQEGLKVDKTYRAMLYTTRLEIGLLPLKWSVNTVQCPVLGIGLTPYLLRMTQHWADQRIQIAYVPGTHHAPYVENPQGTADAIAQFLSTI